jgi:hypothetical protein
MGSAISNLLFGIGDDYNRVSKHNCNFKCTQAIRLIMMFFTLAVLGSLMYIWAKSILAQLVIFSLGIWFFAQTLIALSAGREVVEVKMLDKIKN